VDIHGASPRNLPSVMPGLVPGIHALVSIKKARRGWPGQQPRP
jgi:hypothetical protein